ncbi:MAG: D-inositol-3-phosphate glycosyltransferase [Holosporales bacterium]
MKRILHVLHSLEVGGIEHYVKDIVVHFANKYPQETFYVACQDGPLRAYFPKNVIHFDVPTHKRSKIFSNARILENICNEHKIEHMHVHLRAPAWSCKLVSNRCQIPYSATFHSIYSHQNFLKRAYNSVLFKGDYVIAISQFIRSHLLNTYKIDANKVKLIAEGIDTTIFDPALYKAIDRSVFFKQHSIPTHHKLVLLPGRFSKVKAQNIAIEAFKGIENATLVLVGMSAQKDVYTQDLQDKAKQNNMPIIFIEATDHLAPYYAIADVILSLCTRPEAFGRVIAEALSMEKCLITTNQGGALELTNNGEFAHLVPPNDVKAVHETLKNVLLLTNEHRSDARAYIQTHYDVMRMYNELEAQYGFSDR